MRQEGHVKDLNEKLHDGSFRRSMMKRYLDAGTSVEEENKSFIPLQFIAMNGLQLFFL